MYEELAISRIEDYERERAATMLSSAALAIARCERLERRLEKQEASLRRNLARMVRLQYP